MIKIDRVRNVMLGGARYKYRIKGIRASRDDIKKMCSGSCWVTGLTVYCTNKTDAMMVAMAA